MRRMIEKSLTDNDTTVKSWLNGQSDIKHLHFYLSSDGDELVLSQRKPDIPNTKIVWVLRNSNSQIGMRDTEYVNEMVFHITDGLPLVHEELMLREVYLPLFKKQREWGVAGQNTRKTFLKQCYTHQEVLEKAIDNTSQSGTEICIEEVDEDIILRLPTNGVYSKVISDTKLIARFEEYASKWIQQCRVLIEEKPDYVMMTPENIPEEKGPTQEPQRWRDRLAKFSNLTQQLNSPSVHTTRSFLTYCNSPTISEWNDVEAQLTDAINEAKENVKYLASFEKYMVPLYSGQPVLIMQVLPSLMSHIQLMYTISRYYSGGAAPDPESVKEKRTERMTRLFCLLTNRMIVTCKDSIKEGGKLWHQAMDPQDLETLITRLEDCRQLRHTYKEEYEKAQTKLLERPQGPQFDFAYRHIFGRIDLFCRRIDKLIEIFMTIKQFKSLGRYSIDDMDQILSRFNDIVEVLKKNTSSGGLDGKSDDLLDYTRPSFDKEYNEFGKQISELESSLQVFINSRFENISSTDGALTLLKKFQVILHQPHLKHDLESKYLVIFHNYGLDLEQVHKTFERHKANPPLVRNVTKVAGSIMWARQLLRKVEAPMKVFQCNKSIMSNQKESKKIIRAYNKISRYLVEYEQLWYNAWLKSIEVARRGLNATLIVKHEGKFFVNFDIEILSLIKEAKAMSLLTSPTLKLPQAAKVILIQEKMFKRVHSELSFTLQEYQRVVDRVIPITRNILSQQLLELDEIAKQGETSLTWTSLTIESYIQRLHNGVQKLDSIVTKVNDIITDRIQANLKTISSTLLVDIPSNVSFSLVQFTSLQERHIKSQYQMINIKNREVEQAIDDVILTILHHQSDVETSSSTLTATQSLKNHFHMLLLKAILAATTRSLKLIKKRVGTRHRSGGFMFIDKPFFDVNVELASNHVILHPSLDEIQKAINQTANSVLICSRALETWNIPDAPQSVFQEVSRNKEIVKVVLLLTGGIFSLKSQVLDYLSSFKRHEYLWKLDREEEYQLFAMKNPPLTAFESELKKYQAIESEIETISSLHTIGSLSLNTTSLKTALKKAAREWRNIFARNLHVRAQKQLSLLMTEMDDWSKKLSIDVTDNLVDLKALMETLTAIRENESEIDHRFEPVQEMYSILRNPQYENNLVTTEEFERVGELHFNWRRLRSLCERRGDQIAILQHGFKKDLMQAVQRFSTDVIVFRNDYNAHGPTVPGITPEEAMNRLKRFNRVFEDKYRKWKTLMSGEILFGLPVHRYPELAATARELGHLEKLYSLYVHVRQRIKGYEDILWSDLVRTRGFQDIEVECKVFAEQCRGLSKGLKQWTAYKELEQTINSFGLLRPLLSCLANEHVKPRHWNELMEVTKVQWKLDHDVFKLGNIIEANIIQHSEAVEEIALKAEKEAQVETLIKTRIQEEWEERCFVFEEWRGRGLLLLKGDAITEVKETLDESQMLLGSINPRFMEPFKETVKLWMQKLVTADKTINLWLEVQQNWQALEAVFSGGDITKQLPNEAKKFNQIDKQWFKIMTKALEVKNVISFCYENEILTGLSIMRDGLENVQRQLSAYLETKKRCFPRFYFVADKELLDILSQASDPTAIQQYVKKLFDGVSHVTFYRVKPKEPGSKPEVSVTVLGSPEGESLPLVDNVHCRGHVEEWLKVLVRQMHFTVKNRISHIAIELDSLRKQESPFFDTAYMQHLIDRYPAQCVLLAIQMLWTADITEYIVQTNISRRKEKMRELGKETGKDGRFPALLDFLIHKTRESALNDRQRTNIETLVTVHVHQLEIWRKVILNKTPIKEKNNFDWLRQVRFYFLPDKEAALVSICDADMEYCNEYLGVKERLVVTPLTDRCYITLSQALAMKMGGAPAGPAGTGKTETTKDLGRTYGIYVVVFNCSDQWDRNAMGKIVKGLAQANAWGCFDEFNRIELPVLSVVAQQMECVLKALKEHKQEFRFVDDQVWPLKSGVGYFITMNPGYAGRHELPENLKVLFRGVTMMVPDRRIIIKVKLASAGYTEKDILSEKFFQLYQLCEQQLSKQRHYDFGLRNILSVLRSSGYRLRAAMETSRIKDGRDFEETLFMRTLLDMNMSKLVYADVQLFLDLLKDIFPGRSPDARPDQNLMSSLKIAWEQDMGYVFHQGLVDKVIQLHEITKVRHGIMVVGAAMCGKSAVYSGLQKSLASMNNSKIQVTRMYPKAITAQEMFGRLDKATGDWHDGIFSHIWKKAVALKNDIWIVCDGPVDAIWIENLNTVLDDNKLLTLAGGDRIPMTSHMKCCFEVENLRNASPATVSRAGIVYISSRVLGWKPIIQGKLYARESIKGGTIPADVYKPIPKQLSDQFAAFYFEQHSPPRNDARGGSTEVSTSTMKDTIITQQAETYIDKIWQIYSKSCKEQMRTSQAHIVSNSFTLVASLIQQGISKGRDTNSWGHSLVSKVFWFSVAWSFGGMLDQTSNASSGRLGFDAKLRQVAPSVPGDPSQGESIFDFYIDIVNDRWVKWDTLVEPWTYPSDDKLNFSTLFIPTIDSTRIDFLLKSYFMQQKPILLFGDLGTAKTVSVEHFLSSMNTQKDLLDHESLAGKKVSFSYATTPRLFYDAMEEVIEKRVGSRAYGPKREKKLVLFVDDLNMPEINEWGDQVTNEIVRQVVSDKGYFSLDKDSEFKQFIDLTYMAAMSKPGGGKNDIPDRLKRHFATLCVPLPNDSSLLQIYNSIYHGRFSSAVYPPRLQWVSRQLTSLSIDCWKLISAKMLPTPQKFHYIFNLRDLTNICQGIMKADKVVFCGNQKEGIDPPQFPDVLLIRLWKHEASRVFADKLNDEEDKRWYKKLIENKVAEYFTDNPYGEDYVNQVPPSSYFVDFVSGQEVDPETGNELETGNNRSYQPVESLVHLKNKLLSVLQMYNATEGKVKKLNLVLFDAAIKHVVRITRVLTTRRGNMLLVGVGGSGKQSLTRLSAFITDHHLFQISISKSYGSPQLFDDLRELYRIAGLKKPVTFIITDNEILQEKFLEYINSFLSTGEIPGLWERDPSEKEDIIGSVLSIAKKELSTRCEQTSDFLWKYFIKRVCDNLHIVLCFSPVGVKFRRRARQFPSIISNCVIDWFFPWPAEALKEVAAYQLGRLEIDCEGRNEDEVRTKLLELVSGFHESLILQGGEYFTRFRRTVFTTPKSYLSFLNSYKSIYLNKYQAIKEGAIKVEKGLQKLVDAGQMIREMQAEMLEQEKAMLARQREIEVQLVEVKEASIQAEAKQAEVSGVKDELAKNASQVQEKKDEANKDLEAALPALEEARSAANDITPSDLKELQASANNPAHLTRVVMDGVLILLHNAVVHPVSTSDLRKSGRAMGKGNGFITPTWDIKSNDPKFGLPPYGGGGKKFISNSDCVKQILEFTEHRKDHINEETCELLDPYIDLAEFNYDDAWSTSHALGGLCKWVVSMYNYIKIARVVEPKMIRLREMESQLHAAQLKLREKEAELAAVNLEKQKQSDRLAGKELELQRMEQRAVETARRVNKADGLIEDLRGERQRWTLQFEANKDTIKRLVGDVAVCGAFIMYCGPFNSEFRSHILHKVLIARCNQLQIPVTETIGNPKEIVRFLVDEQQITDWQLEGLPTDEHSIQNAIMISQNVFMNPPKYPLLIDPQGQGIAWLKQAKFPSKDNSFTEPTKAGVGENFEGDELPSVRVCQLNDRNLMRYLQEQMESGKTLLIENVGHELDPVLDPVLDHCIAKGRKPYIPIQSDVGSDFRLDYHSNFKIFFATKLPNPLFSPELFAKVSVIDFTVTMTGLEQQLLSDVIGKERKELEEERLRLIEKMNENKKMLSSLEDKLLTQLSTSSTNLIDDDDLITTLAENKKKSGELTEKQTVAEETRKRINSASLEYLPVAIRGSVLYFLIVELSLISPMYQTSLLQFRGLFDNAIREVDVSLIAQKRIETIVNKMTQLVFTYIDCGLFTNHKLLFVLLLACKILQRDDQLSPTAFQTLLKGGAHLTKQDVKAKPVAWLPNKAWLNLMAASNDINSHVFRRLPESISRYDSAWKQWYDSEAPESLVPPDLDDRLELFDRLLLVRCLREDRTMLAARNFVSDVLGPEYANSPTPDVDHLADTTDPLTPIIFILSPGSDPTQMITGMARRKRKIVRDVSMGEGQEVQAMSIINHILPNGEWALLQNCHLSIGFLTALEEKLILCQGDRDRVHPEARIWITAEPTVKFPIGLLQVSIKLTNEPPAGIRAGIRRSFAPGSQGITQELIEAFRRPEWKPLLVAQTFLHSLVQERRKFGPIGFCIPYEFNSGDLNASLMFLNNHFTQIGDEYKKEKAGTQVSWDTIRFMIAKIQYGGRITDSKDEELFDVIAAHVLSPELVTDKHQFGKGFPLPSFDEISKYREFFDTVYPDVDPPEVFGLHANADLVYRSQMVHKVLNTIISIQPKESTTTAGTSREEVVAQEAARLLKSLPQEWSDDQFQEAKEAFNNRPNSYLTTPLTIFWSQEVVRLTNAIRLIRSQLSDLQLAIAGTIVMSGSLQDILDSLFDARIPPEWEAVTWKATVLGSWWVNLQKRFVQLDKWMKEDRPSKFWLAGFYNPQGFLTSVSQEVTRAHAGDKESWSLDESILVSEVTKLDENDSEKQPSEGVYVYGLYLDGAGWDRMKCRLRDPLPKAEPSRMPLIHISAEAGKGLTTKTIRKPPSRNVNCAVYRYPQRGDSNWVFDCGLGMAEGDTAPMWIRRGIALLLSVD
eukprot:TRINITY_DN11858_c1_g1_i1.p1 TRINITY_DN11858_c1_g1~~TRINITY_DN11858_c1_g1_i1.p1  ORF type:complete len:4751 (+),score=995.77 TRINITY_DN11858_c1_g1_i1:132-14255(+)